MVRGLVLPALTLVLLSFHRLCEAQSGISGCDTWQTQFGENCYYLNVTNATWPDALLACKTGYTGRLATVDSEALQMFLEQLVDNSTLWCDDVWLGARTPMYYQSVSQDYVWSQVSMSKGAWDGNPVTYTNWFNTTEFSYSLNKTVPLLYPVHPLRKLIPSTAQYSCIAMGKSVNYTWINQDCMWPATGFICQYEQRKPISVKIITTMETPEFGSPRHPFIMRCMPYGYPIPQLTFYKDGVKLNFTMPGTSMFMTGSASTALSLVIHPVDARHSGEYTCKATNPYHSVTTTKTIPQVLSPAVTGLHPQELVQVEGGEYKVKCVAEGFPRPTVSWIRGGSKLGNLTGHRSITFQHTLGSKVETSILTLFKTDTKDSGNYECVAENKLNQVATKTAKLTVLFNVDLWLSTKNPLLQYGEREKNLAQLNGILRDYVSHAQKTQSAYTVPARITDRSLDNPAEAIETNDLLEIQNFIRTINNGKVYDDGLILKAIAKKLLGDDVGFDLSKSAEAARFKTLLQSVDAAVTRPGLLPDTRAVDSRDDTLCRRSVLAGLDRALDRVAATLPGGRLHLTMPTLEIDILVDDGASPSGSTFRPNNSADSLTLDRKHVLHLKGKKHYIHSSLGTLNENITDNDGRYFALNSNILGFTLLVNRTKHSVPVSFSMSTQQKTVPDNGTHTQKQICAYMSKRRGQKLYYDWGWSTEGCELVSDVTEKTSRCDCSHTTSFGVLMSITPIPLTKEEELSLTVISYVGCAVSITSCVVGIIVFLSLRLYKNERTVIHINLSVCLIVLQITFMAGVNQTHIKSVCTAVTFILHLSGLCVFTWMLAEGLQLYSKIVKVFGSENSKIWLMYIIGYVPPVIIVAAAAGINIGGYTDPSRNNCWLSMKKGFHWAFIGPVLLILVINLIITIMVLRVIITSTTKMAEDKKESLKSAAKGLLILLPITGLCWLFGIMSVGRETLVFQYLFAGFNSFQGFFIFLFHCVCNGEVKAAYKKWKDRRDFESSFAPVSSSNYPTKDTAFGGTTRTSSLRSLRSLKSPTKSNVIAVAEYENRGFDETPLPGIPDGPPDSPSPCGSGSDNSKSRGSSAGSRPGSNTQSRMSTHGEMVTRNDIFVTTDDWPPNNTSL